MVAGVVNPFAQKSRKTQEPLSTFSEEKAEEHWTGTLHLREMQGRYSPDTYRCLAPSLNPRGHIDYLRPIIGCSPDGILFWTKLVWGEK